MATEYQVCINSKQFLPIFIFIALLISLRTNMSISFCLLSNPRLTFSLGVDFALPLSHQQEEQQVEQQEEQEPPPKSTRRK